MALTDDALSVIDSWVQWMITGTLDPDSVLAMIRTELMKLS
jgi:hypothetical protein